jgi:hypothetical protein
MQTGQAASCAGGLACCARRILAGVLLADVGQQRHEAGALDRVLHRPLERGAVAAALAAKEFALAGAHFLQALHVFVIDEGRSRATFLGAETATILASTT